MKTEKLNPNAEVEANQRQFGSGMKTFRVGCFGIATDICGGDYVEAKLTEGSKVADLKAWLISRYPGLEELRHFFIARNQAYAKGDEPIEPGDELVIIPPVAGG